MSQKITVICNEIVERFTVIIVSENSQNPEKYTNCLQPVSCGSHPNP